MNSPIWEGYLKDRKRQDLKISTQSQGVERNPEISKDNQVLNSEDSILKISM